MKIYNIYTHNKTDCVYELVTYNHKAWWDFRMAYNLVDIVGKGLIYNIRLIDREKSDGPSCHREFFDSDLSEENLLKDANIQL